MEPGPPRSRECKPNVMAMLHPANISGQCRFRFRSSRRPSAALAALALASVACSASDGAISSPRVGAGAGGSGDFFMPPPSPAGTAGAPTQPGQMAGTNDFVDTPPDTG